MTIEYKIDEKDFLMHQLYVASKSERIKKKRQRNKLVLPLIYAALGLLMILDNKYAMSILFFTVGLLWFLLYPLWERRHYVKHYLGFIKENYNDRIGKTGTVEFSNEFIIAKDIGSESKVLTTELEEIGEIPSTIFVRVKGGQSLILPKDKIADIDYVTTRLKEFADLWKIKYCNDDKWEWK